jgi:hypothetical protein
MQIQAIIALVIILVILLAPFVISRLSSSEQFQRGPPDRAFIRLYEGYGARNLAFEYSPEIDYEHGEGVGQGYIRRIMPINLKSVDIYLPPIGNRYDEIRRIEIWSVDRDDVTASTESGFYNSYLQPESELRANPAKFQQLVRALPGDHLRVDIVEPVKKIFLIAII